MSGDAERYEYAGYSGARSVCEVSILRRDGQPPIVIFTELPDNPGTSVTNMIEHLAAEIQRRDSLPAETIWIEHYPAERRPQGAGESWDLVTFAPNTAAFRELRRGRWRWTLGTPEWKRISAADVAELLAREAVPDGR